MENVITRIPVFLIWIKLQYVTYPVAYPETHIFYFGLMVTCPYEWKILEWTKNLRKSKQA